ncbi:hypothetical protein PybrP1_006735 [[Pythium] brassicae (nom. inval.)]|nr:hypothetical protein PybrP1_006735 [[Pythium] brassicae (nom. inval.)]
MPPALAAEVRQLLFEGPPQHQAVLLALGGAALLLVLLALVHGQRSAAAQRKSPLRRRMSNIGMTTLVSEVATNLSIPVSVLKIRGRVTRAEFAARLQTRMRDDPFFARFRSVVVNDDRAFVETPDFDAARNVFAHELGDGESPLAFVESLVNRPLDFAKPLWEAHVIADAADETATNIAWKLHHCIGDGASLSTALIRLSDNKDQFDEMIRRMQQRSGGDGGAAANSLREALAGAAHVLTLCAWSAYVIAKKSLVLCFRAEPTTMFKRQGGTAKHLSYTVQYSVATTKQIGHQFDATVNDVMLSCVAGAMRKTMLAAGQRVAPGLVVRAAVPVDMRSSTEVIESAHNKFSALVVDFPVGVADGAKRLRMVQAGMHEAKCSLEKHFTYALSHVVAKLPAPLMKAVVHFTSSRISVAVSNVRGSSFEVSMCGKPVIGFYGFVPPPPSVNLGIAILSVGDDLGLNVLVDPSVGIDSTQFLEFANDEYEALRRQALDTPESKKDK